MKKNKHIEDIIDEKISPEEQKLLQTLRNQNLTQKEYEEIVKGFKHPNKAQIKKYNLDTGTNFKFAILGDTHYGNKSTDKYALQTFYDFAYKQNVRQFFHCGDLIDGSPNMHKGMIYEQYAVGFSEQAKDVVNDYPHKKDAITYYITGNHDQSYKKDNGARLEELVSKERQDMVFLGEDEADVEFGNGSKLRLLHPGGGSSYATSYRLQKIIESYSGNTKPNILAAGHFHKSMQMFYRNVFGILVGTFEHQTPFMRGKGLSAHMGGWIVEGKSGNEGGIKYLTCTFVPFMKA